MNTNLPLYKLLDDISHDMSHVSGDMIFVKAAGHHSSGGEVT